MPLSIRLAESADVPGLAVFNAAMALETEHLELDGERLRAPAWPRWWPIRRRVFI
ncbi:MAG: hypothetical protein R2724_06810 [Bryobacterales bacterium]